jgi:hypothetical protein
MGSIPSHANAPVEGLPATSKRVAVMQPYFFPYAGYFRLMLEVDEFVIFDCVQFPRRGRVHRCEVPGPRGAIDWLTLPLARQPRDILIRELAFSDNARPALDSRLSRLPWVGTARGPCSDRIRDFLFGPLDSVIDYLGSGLKLVAELLGLQVTITRSSDLDISPDLRGQDRVIAVAKAAGAAEYLNPPGGRNLYEAKAFERNGLRLSFLPEYAGHFFHLLPALMTCSAASILDDIRKQCHPCDEEPGR